jgi:hypothetical protein
LGDFRIAIVFLASNRKETSYHSNQFALTYR